MSTDQHRVDTPREQVVVRWAILEHAQAREQANIAATLVDFSDVPPAVAIDLYYKVADRAAAPAGQPGAFSRHDLRGLDKFLRGELRFQLLHYKRDRRRAVPDPEDTLAATTGPSDPAREVRAARGAPRHRADRQRRAFERRANASRARVLRRRQNRRAQARRDPASPRLERASDQAITQRAARARRRVAMASDGRAHPRRAHQRAACARAAHPRAWPGRAVRERGRRRRSRRHAARRRGHEDRRRVPGVSGLWRRALRRARPPPHSANQDDNPGDAHATGAPSGPRSPDTGHDPNPHPIRIDTDIESCGLGP